VLHRQVLPHHCRDTTRHDTTGHFATTLFLAYVKRMLGTVLPRPWSLALCTDEHQSFRSA
jgi:hypothetical protein